MMFEVFVGVLAALAVKEVYDELMDKYAMWKYKQEINNRRVFEEHLEDLEADDEY